MAKNILKAIFAGDDTDEPEEGAGLGDGDPANGTAIETGRPRSLVDAWGRIAEQNRRLEKRLEGLESAEREVAEVARELSETSKQQLAVLSKIGDFHVAAEKRGRQMENAFQGVPDVLRTLPTATREQAEKLSEIAARLYEKAQDNTVSALKSAQANHQRAIEDLIDKSLGASRSLTVWAMILTAISVAMALFMFFQIRVA